MKKIPFLILFISAIGFSQVSLDRLLKKWNKKNVPYISVETLALQKTKALILDAREQNEFEISHIEKAVLVGYKKFNIKETLKKLPENKNQKIVVYCSLGIRSETIAYKLINAGYNNVYNLYGGIFEWKNNNFIVVDTLGLPTEKVHTVNRNWSRWLKKGQKIYE